jgi:hypothetical protein
VKQVSILRMKLRIPKPWLRALLTPVFRMKDTSNYRSSSRISILLINTGYKRDLYQSDVACTKYLQLNALQKREKPSLPFTDCEGAFYPVYRMKLLQILENKHWDELYEVFTERK